MKDIAGRIAYLMQKNKVSAYQLCRKYNMSQGHFSAVLRRVKNKNLTVEQINNVADYFGVTIDWIVNGDSVKTDSQLEKLKSEIIELEKKLALSENSLKLISEIDIIIQKYKIRFSKELPKQYKTYFMDLKSPVKFPDN